MSSAATLSPPTTEWSQSDTGLVSADAASWAIRLFCGREPIDNKEIEFHRQHPNLHSLRKAFIETSEFNAFLQSQTKSQYKIPVFLLSPPEDPMVPWSFYSPSLSSPVSQLCTHGQMISKEFLGWMYALQSPPNIHRKAWEFAYIISVLRKAGVLTSGKKVLGFGVGRESLPSLFASHGMSVTATDAPLEAIEGTGWQTTSQHSTELLELHRPAIVNLETFRRYVSFRSVDMNAIPAELTGFDACWSSCCFEHLGSLKHGLEFVENSLRCLVPGGIAVHTTEFNLTSNDKTIETPTLSIFRKRDIEELAARLTHAGHKVWPLNFHPGDRELDAHVDAPPYSLPHLKLLIGSNSCTSIGIAVQKAK